MTLIAYSSARHEDLRDVVSKIVQEQNDAILDLFLVQDMAATDITHKWVNKKLKGDRDSLASAMTNSTTTVTVTNAASKRIILNKTYAKIDDELMLVTNVSSNTLTVTRAQLGTSATTHNAGKDVFFMHLFEEGADNSDDHSQTGSKDTNVTKIFRRELKLSGTSQAVKSVGMDNLWTNQVEELLAELLQELRTTFVQSNVEYTDGDESLRFMAGLPFFATNKQDQAGSLISSSIIDRAIEELLENGANPNDLVMLAPTRQVRFINDLKIARIIGGGMASDDRTLRQNVDTYEFTDALVKVVRVPELAKDEIYIGERGKAKIVPLRDRSFRVEEIGKVGDSIQKLLIGEYTAEVMNGAEAFIRLSNLATS